MLNCLCNNFRVRRSTSCKNTKGLIRGEKSVSETPPPQLPPGSTTGFDTIVVKTFNTARYFVSFFIKLTLYIKIGSGVDSFTHSILSQTPIISRIVSVGFKTERVSLSHSIPIFHPRNLWGWVPSGITMECSFCSFHNSLVGWFPCKAWWN